MGVTVTAQQSRSKLEVNHYYMCIELGAFMVRHISDNGILLTIFDSYGNAKRRSYLTFEHVTEIEKETFDNLYRKHVRNARLSGYHYTVYENYAY